MGINEEIKEIGKLLKNNGKQIAVEKFTLYLNIIVGQYAKKQSKQWSEDWRANIYEFGKIFNEVDATEFIEIIDKKISEDTSVREVLEFLKSEICINFFSFESDYIKNYLLELTKEFPTNTEFHNDLGHIYANEKDHLKSLLEYKTASSLDPQNRGLLETWFNAEKNYFDYLITNDQFELANNQVEYMLKNEKFKESFAYNNINISLFDRLKDHNLIKSKIDNIDNLINKKTDAERIKLIEVLGYFIAFIAFVLTSFNLALSNLKYNEILALTFSMALIFIIFNISLSLVFRQNDKTIFKESKFWLLITLIVLLGAFILISIHYNLVGLIAKDQGNEIKAKSP